MNQLQSPLISLGCMSWMEPDYIRMSYDNTIIWALNQSVFQVGEEPHCSKAILIYILEENLIQLVKGYSGKLNWHNTTHQPWRRWLKWLTKDYFTYTKEHKHKHKTACLPKFILFTMSSSLKNHDFVLDSYKTSTEGESIHSPT